MLLSCGRLVSLSTYKKVTCFLNDCEKYLPAVCSSYSLHNPFIALLQIVRANVGQKWHFKAKHHFICYFFSLAPTASTKVSIYCIAHFYCNFADLHASFDLATQRNIATMNLVLYSNYASQECFCFVVWYKNQALRICYIIWGSSTAGDFQQGESKDRRKVLLKVTFWCP